MQDTEILAMSAISAALSELDPDARKRVLTWAKQRYLPAESANEVESPAVTRVVLDQPRILNNGIQVQTAPIFPDIPALFDAANPDTGPLKALVLGYWYQVQEKNEDFDSFTLNRALKDLGHPSANITRDLDRLMERTPRLVIQTRKLGSSKQARKQYKVTREGIKLVESMVAGGRQDYVDG